MKIKFNNYAKSKGKWGKKDWYKWEVFVDESDEVLDRIESVEYRLHKTFPDPVRTIDERESHFLLKSQGWGEFTIHITVSFKNGEEVNTKYELDLRKPWRN